MKVYRDNCCFNRPFDDQSQLRIKLESEAKLRIQDEIRAGRLQLIWSYILELENDNNPYDERKMQINEWKKHAIIDIQETPEIIDVANSFIHHRVRKVDALHIACAINSKCDYFLTTDDKVLKKNNLIEEISIIDPFGFVKEIDL